jgi:hypothetical protein
MSNLFDEFVMERCEEIITKDEKCLIVSREVCEASKAFFNSLSPDQQKEYLKFESIAARKNSCHSNAIYRQAFQDSKSMV